MNADNLHVVRPKTVPTVSVRWLGSS